MKLQPTDAVLNAAVDWGHAKLREERVWEALKAATYPPEIDALREEHRVAREALAKAWKAFDDAHTAWDLEARQ
ncbi:hypothetical protein [Caulobacter segnis]|uniref:Uncharacterized protein n=1 Tax=Caulobacter segnis TaxID=88688 RepID=A0A2W5VAY1_9CAUL|nr:hypothetical protein [Caulobacter segnis]PZR35787.1 MAG: hypothetical protein DI526_05730 [Caulobacter segnis]